MSRIPGLLSLAFKISVMGCEQMHNLSVIDKTLDKMSNFKYLFFGLIREGGVDSVSSSPSCVRQWLRLGVSLGYRLPSLAISD